MYCIFLGKNIRCTFLALIITNHQCPSSEKRELPESSCYWLLRCTLRLLWNVRGICPSKASVGGVNNAMVVNPTALSPCVGREPPKSIIVSFISTDGHLWPRHSWRSGRPQSIQALHSQSNKPGGRKRVGLVNALATVLGAESDMEDLLSDSHYTPVSYVIIILRWINLCSTVMIKTHDWLKYKNKTTLRQSIQCYLCTSVFGRLFQWALWR